MSKEKAPAVLPTDCAEIRKQCIRQRVPFGEASFVGYTAYIADGAPLLLSGRPHPLTGEQMLRPVGYSSFISYMRWGSRTRHQIGHYILVGLGSGAARGFAR